MRTRVEWVGSSRTDTRNGYRFSLISFSARMPVRVDHEHEAIPARIDGNDPHGKRGAEQADAAVSLREQRRGIDEGKLDAPACNILGQDRGTRRQSQPWSKLRARSAPDGNDHVAVSAVWRGGIARDVQADLPERLGANKVRASRQRFHHNRLRSKVTLKSPLPSWHAIRLSLPA